MIKISMDLMKKIILKISLIVLLKRTFLSPKTDQVIILIPIIFHLLTIQL